MKKYFFDCGTHMFQGFREFAQKYNIDSSWECYCFEPNPLTYSQSKMIYEDLISNYNINHLNNAISDSNELVKMKCSLVRTDGHQVEVGTFTDQGSTILKKSELINGWSDINYEEHEVNSIDFSEFLSKKVKEEDYVLIKMDIEGSEFNVLDKIIEDNNYNLIDAIYVEFHERNFKNQDLYIQKKEHYIKFFRDNKVEFFEWI